MNSLKRLFVLIAFAITFLIINLSAEVLASPQQFSAEGEYRLGDRDTREDAKKFALADAKRKVVEQAGVYVESYTEVNNFQIAQDKIKVFVQSVIAIKSERTEFVENGVVCKAYVTATIDTDSFEKKLLEMVKKLEKDAERRENERIENERKKSEISQPEPRRSSPREINNNPVKPKPETKVEPKDVFDTRKYDVPSDLSGDLAELEEARSKMIRDLSKATAYTAGSEYKLQEVTGMKGIGNHYEKGEIANYLKDNFEMGKNYRYAELTPFVEVAGAEKIMKILNDISKKKLLDAKDRMTWAKIERARAKSYGEIVLKEAEELFNRANALMVDANEDIRKRLKVIRLEADDAVKLVRALELRNKYMDEVVKKYEKANKITAKNDKYNPKKKKNFFEDIFKI